MILTDPIVLHKRHMEWDRNIVIETGIHKLILADFYTENVLAYRLLATIFHQQKYWHLTDWWLRIKGIHSSICQIIIPMSKSIQQNSFKISVPILDVPPAKVAINKLNLL